MLQNLYNVLMLTDEFKTLKENFYISEVKKSKFIAHGFSVGEAFACKSIIEKIRKKYHDAKHHVYAFVLSDGTSRSSDDKEPSGTAGIQVLNAINNHNLKNTLIIVTRYFGGILLGTGGLSRAYYSSADLLIKNSVIVEEFVPEIVNLELSYSDYNKILVSESFNISKTEFYEKVKVEFKVKKNQLQKFRSELENLLSSDNLF